MTAEEALARLVECFGGDLYLEPADKPISPGLWVCQDSFIVSLDDLAHDMPSGDRPRDRLLRCSISYAPRLGDPDRLYDFDTLVSVGSQATNAPPERYLLYERDTGRAFDVRSGPKGFGYSIAYRVVPHETALTYLSILRAKHHF